MATSAPDLDLRIVQRIRLIENCMLHRGFCVHCSLVLLSQVFGKTPNFVYACFTLGRYLMSPGNTPISWGYNAVATQGRFRVFSRKVSSPFCTVAAVLFISITLENSLPPLWGRSTVA